MADEQVGKAQEVERAASKLESEMREAIAKTQTGTRIMLVVGILVIIFVFFYLTWLTSRIKKELEPETLVATAESYATTEALPRLQKALVDQAPAVAQALREQAVGYIPVVGKMVEEQALRIADDLVDRLDVAADKTMSEMVAQQKKELQPLIEQASDPTAAAEIEKIFTDSLEELVGVKMDELLLQFDRGMKFVDSRLTRFLDPNAVLTPEEQAEKYLIQEMMKFMNDVTKTMVEELGGKPPSATPPAPASSLMGG